MEPLGPKLRRQRRRLGLTLDDLTAKTGISKPYLSLIETGRVPNPPSDEKLRKLEQTLGFTAGELISQAHLQRTPRDVRAMLSRLMQNGSPAGKSKRLERAKEDNASTAVVDLDDAYLTGVLHEMVENHGSNVEPIRTNSVPVINKVAAGYPTDFTDLSYPRGVADEYVGCPEVNDKDAFATRVHGDSMIPKYRAGDIVIFSPAAGPRNGDDCFIRFDDGTTTFKRVFFENDDAGKPVIRLQPRNEKYRAKVIEAEKVTGVYRAMYKYQSVED